MKSKAAPALAHTSDTRVWNRPEASWLTLERAPFYFAPDYAEPGISFEKQAASTITARPNERFEVVAIRPDAVNVNVGSIPVTFDGATGAIILEDDLANEINPGEFTPYGSPPVFLGELNPYIKSCQPQYRNDLQAIQYMVQTFWSKRQRFFLEAVRDGHASIVGRFGAISTPFRVIEPDQWRYFDMVVDRERPERSHAVSSLTGELIFSPLVMPVPRKVTAQEREIIDAVSWLVSHMQETQNAPSSKQRIQELVMKRWPNVSGNSYKEKIWPTAKAAIVGNTYGRVGAPKKSNQSGASN
jgi:hypothetical protein